MSLFYQATQKEILKIRNTIIKNTGIPILEEKGFKRSPFSTSWYGKDDLHGFTYNLCRLTDDSTLQDLEIQIVRGDNWIRIILNIFKLQPHVQSLDQLQGVDGLQFKLPPNSMTEMRLRSDDIKGPPIFSLGYMAGHKLRSFYTRRGLAKSIENLTRNIATDLNDIDRFVVRWHELHQPLTTNWTGHQIKDS